MVSFLRWPQLSGGRGVLPTMVMTLRCHGVLPVASTTLCQRNFLPAMVTEGVLLVKATTSWGRGILPAMATTFTTLQQHVVLPVTFTPSRGHGILHTALTSL